MADVTFRVTLREDVPAVVRSVAEDILGAGREHPTDPLSDSCAR